MPLISVILPCYNSETLIGGSIRSIINQTFTDWELIIVDDASKDQSVNVIKGFDDKRIKLIQLSINGGYPIAMNAGIGQAQGKYIARMDADDVSAPSRLKDQLEALENYPDASFCGTNRFRITPGNKAYIDKVKDISEIKWESWEDLMIGRRTFTDASVLIKLETIKAVGGYRTYQRSGMDVDLWLRVMEKFGPAVILMKPLYGRTIDPNSLVFNPNTSAINQIPRVLARQRVERGVDDVQEGKSVSLKTYQQTGLIKESTVENRTGLLFGSLVTCLWLRDLNGAAIYFRHLRRNNDLSLLKIIFAIINKVIQRIRNNPFKRFIIKIN